MKHKLDNLDLMYTNYDNFFDGEKAEFTYVDPPWTQGAIGLFSTMNLRQGSRPRLIIFLERLLYIIERHTIDSLAFIEIGKENLEMLLGLAKEQGYTINWVLDCTYQSKRLPMHLVCISKNDKLVEYNPEGLKLHAEEVPNWVFEHYDEPGSIVFDPCLGLGTTLKMAIKYNMICYGAEFNNKRLDRAKELIK